MRNKGQTITSGDDRIPSVNHRLSKSTNGTLFSPNIKNTWSKKPSQKMGFRGQTKTSADGHSKEEITNPFCVDWALKIIPTIAFDVKTSTFYLSTIALDVNTEVILRNLVAYEGSNASGPLVFTHGVIDTEENVKALRARKNGSSRKLHPSTYVHTIN